VLHGIGGRTVAEAKMRMSYAEAIDWMAYIRQNGPLNTGLRLEFGVAQLLHAMYRLMGNDVRLADFLPDRVPEDEPVATIQDVMAILNRARR